MKRKCLAIGIILLFVGVTMTPTINFNTVKAFTDDDLVEVTTQACGIKGYKDTTVKLTREQYQSLEEYLVEFRARLNQTSTREEAIPIFKDAVVELDKYGLLPRGMSVQHAQKLVTTSYQNRLVYKFLEKGVKKISDGSNNNTNSYCLIFGNTDTTYSFNLLKIISSRVLTLSLEEEYEQLIICRYYLWAKEHNLTILANMIYLLYTSIMLYGLSGGYLSAIFPLDLFSGLTLGGVSNDWDAIPAKGFVFTIGKNGLQNYIGNSLYGNFTDFLVWIPPIYPIKTPITATGIIGFTGISFINLLTRRMTYIGSALSVNIISDPLS